MIDYFNQEIESGETYFDAGFTKIRECNLGWFKDEAEIEELAQILHREPTDELWDEVDAMTLKEFEAEIFAERETFEPDYSWEREDYRYERNRDEKLVRLLEG